MNQSEGVITSGGGTCGQRLRLARETAGLTHQDAAARLRIPARTVRALEADDWDQLGAPVFVKGHLRGYARLLGLDIEPELRQFDTQAISPPDLVSHSHTPRYQRVFEQITRRAVYIVLTAAIVVPVWLATPDLSNGSTVESLDLPPSPARPDPAGQPDAESLQPRTPLIASMASLSKAGAPAFTLDFSGSSWVQVFAPDGRLIEQGLLGAGQQRRYGPDEAGRVVLGNATVVKLSMAGNPVDLAPFSRANVARFTLSSDGSLTPVVD